MGIFAILARMNEQAATRPISGEQRQKIHDTKKLGRATDELLNVLGSHEVTRAQIDFHRSVMKKAELQEKLSEIHTLLIRSMMLHTIRAPGYDLLIEAEDKLNNLESKIALETEIALEPEPDSNLSQLADKGPR
jgi:hypothetical protein